jgi:hypothetical protein
MYSALVHDKSDQCLIDIGNDNVDNFICYHMIKSLHERLIYELVIN